MTVHQHGERPYEWVGALSDRRATLTPERVGLVDADTGTEYTYDDLDRRANRTARLLRSQGVGQGDRVAVVSRNRPELVDLYFATGKIGAVLAPLSHRLAPREIGELLAQVEPRVLVVEEPFAGDVVEALDGGGPDPDVATVFGLPAEDAGSDEADADADESAAGDASTGEDRDGDGPGAGPDATAYDEVGAHPADAGLADRDWPSFPAALPDDASPVDPAEVALTDPHLFLHTGGSTGLPKEVVLTHGGIAWNAFNTILSWGLRPDDVTPMVFPMFHTGGWNVITIPLFHLGGTVIVARDFDPGRVLDLLESYECSVLVAVPAVLRFMVQDDDWDATDLSSLRFAKSGGGPCRDAIIDAWSERGVALSQGYGLTECGPNNFAMPEGFPREKTDSIGKPGLYVDARVVDEDGKPLPSGEVGELELASPHAADRYWRNAEETEATFGDGWISTGDLARVDDEGYFHIEGRKKNMFVSGGENVSPPEVEDAVADHLKVEEVIVVPVPDETWGEVGKAVVEGDESLTLEELQSFLEGKLASFKVPKHLAFVDEMPTSGPSKIDRGTIEEEFGGENGE